MPESLLPAATLTLPLRPPLAFPVRRTIQPAFPDAASPEFNVTPPEAPADDAADDCKTSEPDPELALEPVATTTAPPFEDNAWPALKIAALPVPLELAPATTLIAPARPPVATPLVSAIQPVFPLAEPPVDTSTAPEVPTDATTDEATVIDPDPPLKLDPLVTRIPPPAATERDDPPRIVS